MPDYTAAYQAMTSFSDLMQRPHRRDATQGIVHTLLLIVVSLVPLLFVLATLQTLPPPPAVPNAPGAGDGTTATLNAVAAALGDDTAVGERDPKALDERLAAIRSLSQATRATPSEIAQQALWKPRILYFCGLTVTIFMAIAVLISQLSIVRRHWARLERQSGGDISRVPPPEARLLLAAPVFLIVAGMVSFRLPEPLLGAPGQPYAWSHEAMVIAAMTLIFACLFVTAFGTFLYALNYPRARDIDAIRRMLLNGQPRGAKPAAVALEAYKAGGWRLPKPVFVHPGLTPVETLTVIQAMVRVAAVLVVVAMVSIRLGLDVIAADRGLGGDRATALAGLHEAWLVLTGVGLSLALAVVYALPAARIGPFVAAAEDNAPSPSKAWHVAGRRLAGPSGDAIELTAAPPSTPPPEAFPPDMSAALGADRAKFSTVMSAAGYGGGFHTLMQGKATEYLKQALTLLAPAAAGTLLALLG